MNSDQLQQMAQGVGFIAALDQSGGSTPSALAAYGIQPDSYSNDAEMFALMHEMRSRIMMNPSFSGSRILAAILFEDTIDRKMGDRETVDYLWTEKHVVPFVKVDKGLAPEDNGARCMNHMPDLDRLLAKAEKKGIFGTKMRSLILRGDPKGVDAVVQQQFAIARQISDAGLIPILEPEIDIKSPDKQVAESLLLASLAEHLDRLSSDDRVILKLTIPDLDNLYAPLIDHPNVVRVVALSGGYHRDEACEKLARNHRMIASFSRALTEGLNVELSDATFTQELETAVAQIYAASIA